MLLDGERQRWLYRSDLRSCRAFAIGAGIVRQRLGNPECGTPWTIYLSGQYDFSLFSGQDFYARVDYTHTTEERRTGAMLQGDPQYDPLLFPNPAYSISNVRLGWRIAGADISLFVNNLTDAHPLLNTSFTHSIGYDPQDWILAALRPRTFGLTLTYRN